MSETVQHLERRLAKLEKEVLAIKRRLSKDGAEPWWRQTAGDKEFAKIVRLGRQIREAERSNVR